MKPTRNLLLAHQRLDAYRVCTELSRSVDDLTRRMPTKGTKDQRDHLKRTASAAVRCIVGGAHAYKAAQKVEHFAAARRAVGMVAAELEVLKLHGVLSSRQAAASLQLCERLVAMLTGLLAKFGGLPPR